MKYRLVVYILIASPLAFIVGIVHTVFTGSYGWAIGFVVAVALALVAFVIDTWKTLWKP